MPTSKRRRPRRNFPHRISVYFDEQGYKKLLEAAEIADENLSQFCAKAGVQRADELLSRK